MSRITNPHDRCFQQLMSQPDNAHAFFRRYLFPELLATIDLDTLELQEDSKVTQAFQQLHTDILYQVDFRTTTDQGKPQKGYLYAIVEHQSTPDPAMAVRLWQYKTALLMNHVQDDYLHPFIVWCFITVNKHPILILWVCAVASVPPNKPNTPCRYHLS